MQIERGILLLIVFGILAVLATALVIRTIRQWTALPSSVNRFDFADLFMEHGEASKGAFVMILAFAATTWAFCFMVLLGKGTETLFGVYGGLWIIPTVAKMISNSPPATNTKLKIETQTGSVVDEQSNETSTTTAVTLREQRH